MRQRHWSLQATRPRYVPDLTFYRQLVLLQATILTYTLSVVLRLLVIRVGMFDLLPLVFSRNRATRYGRYLYTQYAQKDNSERSRVPGGLSSALIGSDSTQTRKHGRSSLRLSLYYSHCVRAWLILQEHRVHAVWPDLQRPPKKEKGG